ncbi:hypothetical protein Zmor_004680 [Zophobas morio]|uniref:Uncharacterized protein n=1 Tax=Zophobas morio TaxID=2755281 RepID=A0AA38MJS8_9CUCU|nr:hypothetical protein Zmor_004680 [Zophobas morio]
MQDEIDTCYENKKEKEDDIKYAIEALKDRRERLQAIFLTKREKVAQLEAVVNKQPYTTADKKRIVQHIDELQHTISLKKESIRVKKTLKDESDIKLADAKKELSKHREDSRNNFLRKIASLKETETSLEKNKQELTELTEIHNKKSNDLETKKQRALEFFRNLHDIIVGNLQEMNNIRTEIFEMLKDCLTKVAETEGAILEDLHNLDDLKM